MRKLSTLLLTLLALSSCIAGGDLDVNIKKNSKFAVTVSNVQIINSQLVITGSGLIDVTNVKVNGNSLNQNFTIETHSANKIIANAISTFSFDVSKVFSLILSDANASAAFPIDFSLCNSTLNSKSFDCSISASDNDVLTYNDTSHKWEPRAPIAVSSSWSVNGSDIYRNTGYVGVGTSGPAYLLDVMPSSLLSQAIFRAGVSGVSNGFAVIQDGTANVRYSFGVGKTTFEDSVGIGAFPTRFLDVMPNSAANQAIMRVGAAGYNDGFTIGQNGSSNLVYSFSGGSVGIGTASPGYLLDVQGGDINASGSVRAATVALTSDKRWKKNIKPLENSIEKLKQITGVSYLWAKEEYPEKHFNDAKQIGVIAQDVQKVFPELVLKDHDGFLSVNYPGLIAPLIEAFKNQQTQIEKNYVENKNLKSEVESLQAKNKLLEQYLCKKDPSAVFCH